MFAHLVANTGSFYPRTSWTHRPGVLPIMVIMWRDGGAHENHIHATFWPYGYRIPPCAGGVETYRYSNGRLTEANGGNVTPEWPGNLPELPSGRTEPHMFCEHKAVDRGPNLWPSGGGLVEYWQRRLLFIDPNALPVWGADGDYGDETASAVTSLIPNSSGDQIGPEEAAFLDGRYSKTQNITLETEKVSVVKAVRLG